jgi:hypothetical protein
MPSFTNHCKTIHQRLRNRIHSHINTPQSSHGVEQCIVLDDLATFSTYCDLSPTNFSQLPPQNVGHLHCVMSVQEIVSIM